MKTATRSDWKTLPLPEQRDTIEINRFFSREQMEQIRKGVVPREMEDKWFIFWEEDHLFFHRS